MDRTKSKYWLDQIVDQITNNPVDRQLVVSSGHSPSGRYHIGIIREFAYCNAIVAGINARKGFSAKHIDFVDDFDALRKIPAGVDDSFKEHIGKPLYIVPSPFGDGSYADHYFKELQAAIHELGIRPEVIFSHQQYQQGVFTPYIRKTLAKLDEVRRIIEQVSGRQLPDDWSPVQILSDSDSLREWQYKGWDQQNIIYYTDKNNQKGEINYSDEPGRVKLDWRLDWPARWREYGVDIEPFGRDHASSGGSYDTGRALVEKIFDGRAPIPVPYDFVNMSGETKKLSKSAGNVITPEEALQIMPPEILRYFMLKSVPKKQLSFDSGIGLFNLIDEYSQLEEAVLDKKGHDFEGAYRAAATGVDQTISRVPFSHLVTAYQTAQGDPTEIQDMLRRTGYEKSLGQDQLQVLTREINFVKNWLEKYAPEEVKFQIQAEAPKVKLSESQKSFLKALASSLGRDEIDGQKMHEQIYAAKDQAGLEPSAAFKTLYQVILGKDYGPKAGWFLASLERDWLIKRLQSYK